MRERRVLWVVLAAFVVGMIAVAGLAAVDDDSSGPPRLPALALGAAGREAAAGAAAAPADSMLALGPVEYRVGDGVLDAALPDHASAWAVDDRVDVDDVRRLASALGVDGTPQQDDVAWTVRDGAHQVRVEKQAGAPWSFSPWSPGCGDDMAVSSDGTVSCGGAGFAGSGTGSAESGAATATVVAPPPTPATSVEPCAMPDCPPDAACAQVCPTPSPEPLPEPPPPPERPADLPSKADAERIARDVLTKAGLDLDGADVRVDDGFSQWMVAVDPVVGGLPTQGMASTVAVGPKGAIQFAGGWLGVPTEGDDYPLAGVNAGVERLKSGYPGGGWSAYPGGPEPAIARDMPACVDCPPQVRTITGVRLGLQFSPVYTSEGVPADALLVPAYFFRFDDTEFEQAVIAVADEFLPTPPEVKPMPGEPAPMPVEPDGGTGSGSTGTAPPKPAG
ncbi:MAG TPA: hypothetical protein VFK42_19145 [Acidimicrobiales bacterium]|nr:hypothetical protein [Acidimicrobiales bacterium]